TARLSIGNLKLSKAILLQAPVERASAQPECLCSFTRVTVISGQRLFYQKCLDLFETHLLDVPRFGAASRYAEIGFVHLYVFRHQDGALHDVIELPDVSRKPML